MFYRTMNGVQVYYHMTNSALYTPDPICHGSVLGQIFVYHLKPFWDGKKRTTIRHFWHLIAKRDSEKEKFIQIFLHFQIRTILRGQKEVILPFLGSTVKLNFLSIFESILMQEMKILLFRCEEHLYTRLRRLVGWSVGWSVPTMRLRGNTNTWKRDCFEKRRRKRKLITSQFHYVAIPSHLGIRRSPCYRMPYKISALTNNWF
jgi:hypothetical protein